jgi:oxygen-independent coproporphyrinogen-3 oxidase
MITSAYIHIPFCTHICHYCDFAKVYIKNQPVDQYLERLIQEYKSKHITSLRTLYIGGGTPTALEPAQLDYLLAELVKPLDLTQLEEFTVEANPGDLDSEKIAILKKHGVNRVSLGVQTFNDKMLKKIGRSHTADQAIEQISSLRQAGFDNITIDLIYALPGQTMDDVVRDLDILLSLNLPHVALYSLILENHTIFMNKMRRGRLDLPDEDDDAEMYEYILDRLDQAGYDHYEVSNFGKDGYQSKHNLMYWDNAEYFGIGAGASGYENGIRYKNHGPVHHYIAAPDGATHVMEEVLSEREQMEEEMFLGLRKKSGVSISKFNSKFNQSFESVYGKIVDELLEKNWVQVIDDHVSMTHQGLLLGNDVFEAFILE